MRANHILPLMLAGTTGCLDLTALQSDSKDAAMPPVEDMAIPAADMATAPADMANAAKDMATPDMTSPPATWTQKTKVNNISMFAIHGKTVGVDTTIWTVGEKSKEVHFTTASNTWTAKDMDAAKTNNFRSVWAASEKVAWAVGDGGLIYKGDNAGNWTPQTSGTASNLTGVFGNSATDIVAVGADDKKFFTSSDGTAWTMLTHNQNAASNGVWTFGQNIFAAAPNGVNIRTANRTAFFLDTVQSMIGNNSVFGIDEKTVYSVGQGGYIAKWDGTQWKASKVDAVTGRDFLSVWATSATDIWAVGKLGMAYRGDGTNWTSVGPATLVGHDLRGVWGDAKGVYFITYETAKNDSFVYQY